MTIDSEQGQEWDSHAPFNDDDLVRVENIPKAMRSLMGARARLREMERINAPTILIEHQQWRIQQLLDQVEMWIDWLREEMPSGKRFEE